MAQTNVPGVQFTPTGLVVPAEAAINAGVAADINAAFGGGLNPAPNTPQGQLAASEAAIIGAKNDELLAVVNGIDPAYAEGRMQDAIARIYFLTRNPPQATVVACTCTGAQSTIIPAGALAYDGVNLWSCVQGGTIPVGGSISLEFACTVTGPIAAPAHAVNRIYQTIPGWDTVDNPLPGVIGSNVESRADFEYRRQQTVAANSVAPIQAIVGAALKVPGVLDAFGYQNDTGAPLTYRGVTLAANEVYICVAGGDPLAVAQALWSKKIPGSPWCSTANTTETVYDTSNGYSTPYPSYTVKFETPAALPILFAVSITNSTQVPANAISLIQAAIMSAFAGADGGSRARIGSTIYASRFYAGVAALGSWVQLIDIKIGTTTANLDSVVAPMNNIPTVSAAGITVTLV